MHDINIAFLFYILPPLLLFYYILSFSRTLQNIYLFTCGVILYGMGEGVFTAILAINVLFNWFIAFKISKPDNTPSNGHSMLLMAISINLALLFFSNYCYFIISKINTFTPLAIPNPFSSHLPFGLAIFTLHSISYLIDVSRKAAPPETNPLYLGLYLMFFPVLFVGPILQYRDFYIQLRERKSSLNIFSFGCKRFTFGFAKINILAFSLGKISGKIFLLSKLQDSVYLPSLLAIVGILSFVLFAYYFLSGFSDMAIGLSALFGFKLNDNFNYPFTACSLTDFWKRWNISAIAWFSHYLFTFLRKKNIHEHFDEDQETKHFGRHMFILWALFGLWHGAGWTLILWGIFNAIIILFERATHFESLAIPTTLKRVYVFFILLSSFTFLRSDSLSDGLAYLSDIFILNHNGFYSDLAAIILREKIVVFIIAISACLPIAETIKTTCIKHGLKYIETIYNCLTPFVIAALLAISFIFFQQQGFQLTGWIGQQ